MATPSRASRLFTPTRTFFGLALMGVLALPLLAMSDRVEVEVDGQVQAVRTDAETVGDVLDELDVEVGDRDELSPTADAEVEHGMTIAVARAVEVEIRINGELAQRVDAPVGSVAEALDEAGLSGLGDEDADIVPSRDTDVADGDVISIWTPQDVRVRVDGEVLEFESRVRDVGALLARRDIELGPHDRLSAPRETPLTAVDELVVQRVEIVEEVEEVELEHGRERRRSAELPEGETRVEQEGAPGVREDTYRMTLVDGEEEERELVAEEVVTESSPEVVVVGTAQPQPTVSTAQAAADGSDASGSGSSGGSSRGSPGSGPAGAPAADDPVWDRLAECEANGNWQNVSSNGMYYGGLQFHPDTWRSVGGSGMPHQASRAEQIHRGQILQARSGWGQWPACSRMLGLR